MLWYLQEDNINIWGDLCAELRNKKSNYAGQVVSVRRLLEADRLLPTWPKEGNAAVVDISDFLDEPLRSEYQDPWLCMLPQDEWPDRVHRSKVYSDQAQWGRIAQAGLEREIKWVVEDKDAFHAPWGETAYIGAMGVDKIKEAEFGEVLSLFRFISIMSLVNDFMRLLERRQTPPFPRTCSSYPFGRTARDDC